MDYKGKTLLIVGAGVFQTFAIKVAKNMGLRVCVLDMNEHAPGVSFADDFIPASTRNIPEAISAAKKFHKKYKLNGVFTCGTDVSYTVANIAQALSLPGVPPKVALSATDKGLMRETLKKHGVPVPDFRVIETLDQAVKAVKVLGFPLVIKPVDNMGARGVRKLESLDDLYKACPAASSHSTVKRIIIERYMPGKELSIDTLVDRGQVHLLTIADRIIAYPPFFIEKGHTIPSTRPKKELDAAFEMAKKGIAALGIKTGAAKFDMKLTEQGPIIGEMTARLSGGFHSELTDPLSTGMNSIKAAIDLSLGNPLDMRDITPKHHYAAAERSIYPKPGRVVSVKGVDRALKMKNVGGIFINVKPGDILHPLTSNIGKAGHVVGWGKTRKEAIANTLNALRTIKIVTEKIR